jgi:Ca2+-binding RTX toxin-like protein
MQRFMSRLFGSQANLNRRSRQTKMARPHLGIEALEDRLVPSTLKIAAGVLTYDAGAGVANNLSVSLSGATYTFKETAETISVLGIAGATGSGTHTVTVPAAQVQPAGMLINLGDKDDVLSIESTANAISVKGGDGNDTIDIGKFSGGALSAIQAPVTVDGEAGSDTLRINDPASGAARSYTVTATKVTPTGGADVNYSGVENLVVTAGDFADTFNVRATAAGTTTTLHAGAGLDTFNVGSAANTLDDIKGPLSLDGGPGLIFHGFPIFGSDTVNLFDQGSGVGRNYTLKAGTVDRTGAAPISYSFVERLTLNTGAFANRVAVQSTSVSTPVTLNLGGGNDIVTLGNAANSLDDITAPLIAAPVTVNGQTGTDAVVLNDQGDGNANTYVVTATAVTRNGSTILNYATVESLTLNAGAFADTVNVQSTLASTPVTLKMGGGDDTVNIGSAGNSLDPILGAVTVDGQAGSDRLTLNDQGQSSYHDYTVTATTVSRNGAALVTYVGTENLTVNAGSPPIIFIASATPSVVLDQNHFVVKSTSANTTLNGLGDTLFTVGSDGNSLDGIQGPLTVNGSTLVLNDQGDGNANSYTITSSTVARSGAALISYAVDFDGLTLNAGAFNDTVLMKSGDATLNMGAGNDTVTFDGGPFARLNRVGFVTVNGQGGADSIVLDDSGSGILGLPGSDFRITSNSVERGLNDLFLSLSYSNVESLELRGGSGANTFTFLSTSATTPVVVQGGSGNDTFKFGDTSEFVTNPSALLGAVTIDGQGGTNTLDYSAYNVGVRVNLALGTATGAAGGISNIQNVTGGSGNDILVGNDQANVLRAGAGRDILIGRGGADTLFGGTGDDILIGDSTVYDLNPAALEDLMREWGRTDLIGSAESQYATRILHLLGLGSGLNGATHLDLSKVIDDGVADSLVGGTGLDWFFQLGADTITGLSPTERVN